MKINFKQTFYTPKTTNLQRNKNYNKSQLNANVTDTLQLTNSRKDVSFTAKKSTTETSNETEYNKLSTLDCNSYKHVKNKHMIECLKNLDAEPEKLIKLVDELSSSLPDKKTWAKKDDGVGCYLEYIDSSGQIYEKNEQSDLFYTEIDLKSPKYKSNQLSILVLPLGNNIKYQFDLINDDDDDNYDYTDNRSIIVNKETKEVITDYKRTI